MLVSVICEGGINVEDCNHELKLWHEAKSIFP